MMRRKASRNGIATAARLPISSWIALMIGLSIGHGGCASTPPSRFYLLAPAEALESVATDAGVAVRVGPVALPGYLSRPQFVTRASGNRLQLAEFDRWAEPLDENVARVLVENLSAALPGASVGRRGAGGAGRMAHQVSVDVGRFECGPGAECVLEARWNLTTGDATGAAVEHSSNLRVAMGGDGFDARAAAMSQLLAELGGAIARAIASEHR